AGNPQRREAERHLATEVLADYAADRPELLADLLLDADETQFAVLFPKVEAGQERASAAIQETLAPDLGAQGNEADKERLAKRQANAAAALLRLEQPNKVWPMLQHRLDPRTRSYLIHRLSPLGAEPRAILERLDSEPDVSIRRALILSLGEFGPEK